MSSGSQHTVIQDISSKDMNILRYKATEAIEKVQLETEELDYELRDKSEKLAQMKHQLDVYRDSMIEKENEQLADSFFATNVIVLRNAYKRFRMAIKDKLKCHHIYNVITAVDNTVLKEKYWKQWGVYLYRRKFMLYHIERRKQAMLLLTMEQWKVYAALQIHIRKCGEINIKRRYVRYWKQHLSNNTFIIPVTNNSVPSESVFYDPSISMTKGWLVIHKNEQYYDSLIMKFKSKCLKRKLFYAWKQVCVNSGRLWVDKRYPNKIGSSSSKAYLAWNTEEILRLEEAIQPVNVFMRTLIRAWRNVTVDSIAYYSTITSHHIPHVMLKSCFKGWREFCVHLWTHRRKLIFRFYDHLRRLVENNRRMRRKDQRAIEFHVTNKLKEGMMIWRQHARDKLKYQYRSPPSVKSITNTVQLAKSNSFASMLEASELSTSYFPLHNTHSVLSTPRTPVGLANMPSSTRSGHGSFVRSFMLSTSLTQTTPTFSYRARKLLKQAMHTWYSISVINKDRHRISLELAIKFNEHFNLSIKGLHVWRTHVNNDIKFRIRICKKLFNQCINTWKEYVVMIKQEKLFIRRMHGHIALKNKKHLENCWNKWLKFNYYNIRCKRNGDLVLTRHNRYLVRVAFQSIWKHKWAHNLHWRSLEMKIENKKLQELIQLYSNAMSLASTEKDKLLSAASTYQEQVVEYSSILENKENQLRIQEEKAMEQTTQINELKAILIEKTESLQRIQEERNRLVSVEKVCTVIYIY